MEFWRRFLNFYYQTRDDAREAWSKLSLTARVNIVLAGVAAMAIMGFVAYWGAKPEYVTLAEGLEPENVRKVTDLLVQNNVPYELSADNKAVSVPLSKRSDMQLVLAEEKLPVGKQTPPGWELFSQNELMTNQWLQDVKYMRALQGELQRQLNAFNFVSNSYVLIREAKEELFVSQQKPSEAAVTLDIKRPLTKQEVKAIVSLIDAAGGPNLNEKNITVTTTTGEVLYMPPQTEFAAIANSKLEMVTQVEKQRETKLQAILKDMGVRGTVTVSAKLNFDQKEETKEEVKEGTPLSSYTTETTNESTESAAAGAPGPFANVPESQPKTAPGTTSTESTTEEINNFEPSRTTTKTKTDPGDVIQYLVTMVVEGEYKEATDADGKTTKTYSGLTEEQKKMYTDVAKAAVGDGDTPTTVTIYDHPYNIAALAETAATAATTASSEQMKEAMRKYMTPAFLILAIIVGFWMLRRIMNNVIQEAEVLIEDMDEHRKMTPEMREAQRQERVQRDIADLSRTDPETVAALLRSWMMEEEG